MRKKFFFTSKARADVHAIWNHIAEKDSTKAADKLLAHIYDECNKLGGTPGLGHLREDLIDSRHRFWRVWSYLIVYRWQSKPIEVIGILHGARDLAALLGPRAEDAE